MVTPPQPYAHEMCGFVAAAAEKKEMQTD